MVKKIVLVVLLLTLQSVTSQKYVYNSTNELVYVINKGVVYSNDTLQILCNIKEKSVHDIDSDEETMTLITFVGDLVYNKRSWFTYDILYSTFNNKIRKHHRYRIYDFVYIDDKYIRLCNNKEILFTFSDTFTYQELITVLYLTYNRSI
jgi:hypothetical protein